MKILIIATNSIKANVKQRFGEYESMELCKKDYLETIDNVKNLKLSYEDFKVNYNNIGTRLKSLTYDFVYYENKNEIFFYNGIETKTSQFFKKLCQPKSNYFDFLKLTELQNLLWKQKNHSQICEWF